jgi:hypothetical protein
MARVVVQVRWRPPVDPDVTDEERDQQWAELALPLFERAGALGGRVIAWGSHFMTVDFAWDGLYDAIDFLVDAPLFPELCSGLCHGEVTVLHEGTRVALAAGTLLRRATQLAELARPGEVLVTPELVLASDGRVGSIGPAGKRPGRPEIEALILDPDEPLRGSMPPSAPRGLELVPLEEPTPTPTSVAPDGLAELQLTRLASATEAIQTEAQSLFPAALSQALKDRDATSLEALAQSARSGPSSDVAERLDAMAHLASGRSGEAIRRLRIGKAKVALDPPAVRSRAALALAVALGTSGRPREALLETLDGLARAREASDLRGERACARFVAQLARSLKDHASAAQWEALCD